MQKRYKNNVTRLKSPKCNIKSIQSVLESQTINNNIKKHVDICFVCEAPQPMKECEMCHMMKTSVNTHCYCKIKN